MDSSLIKQRKVMAMGGSPLSGSDFGAAPLSSTTRGGGRGGAMPDAVQQMSSHAASTGDAGLGAKTMKDGQRTAPVSHSRGRSQANPDHGSY